MKNESASNFNAIEVKNEIVKWIRKTFEEIGSDCNAVVGISGGKDSSVVAALCAEALGKDRVIGVLMPNTDDTIYKDCNDDDSIKDSELLLSILDIQSYTIDIRDPFIDIMDKLEEIFNPSEQTIINLPARIRMATLYAVSQSVNGRVANTCNLSEDWVGYSTRYGDSVGDFSPLSMLTTDEVIAVGDACGLPEYLTHKTPSDGLCGKTDEENLGFSYAVLNRYIREGVCDDESIKERIDYLHKKNKFKLQPMPYYKYPGEIRAEL